MEKCCVRIHHSGELGFNGTPIYVGGEVDVFNRVVREKLCIGVLRGLRKEVYVSRWAKLYRIDSGKQWVQIVGESDVGELVRMNGNELNVYVEDGPSIRVGQGKRKRDNDIGKGKGRENGKGKGNGKDNGKDKGKAKGKDKDKGTIRCSRVNNARGHCGEGGCIALDEMEGIERDMFAELMGVVIEGNLAEHGVDVGRDDEEADIEDNDNCSVDRENEKEDSEDDSEDDESEVSSMTLYMTKWVSKIQKTKLRQLELMMMSTWIMLPRMKLILEQ